MSSTTMARCPKCSTAADSDRITEVMNRFGFIGRGRRLTCKGCGTRLAIRATQANLVWLVLFSFAALQVLWLTKLNNETAKIVILIAALLVALYLHHKLAPRLARLEVPSFGEEDRTPLEVEMTRVAIADLEAATSVPVPETPNGPPTAWRCRSCQEDNPERFEICWKCGASWNQQSEDI